MQHLSLPKSLRVNVNRVSKEARKQGARDGFHPQMVSEIAELSAAGWTDREIAAEMGVSVATLYRWKGLHDDFRAALEANSKAGVERVAGTLFNLANGYSYIEQEAIKVKTGEHTEEVQVVDVVKHQPANPSSAIFYLKNRDRQNWREQTEIGVQGSIDVNVKHDIRDLAIKMLAMISAGIAAPTIEHQDDETQAIDVRS